MEPLEFSFAVELTFIHSDPCFVGSCLDFFIGGTQYGSQTEIDNAPNFAFIQLPDKFPDLRIDTEGVIRIAQEQNIYRFFKRRTQRERLRPNSFGNGFRKAFCIPVFV